MFSRKMLAIGFALLGWSVSTAAEAKRDADVLIVGAGISGLSAALEAARNEAIVHVVDMASVFGGHAVMSEGGVSIV
jgi:succinate dehydrogenase/fumarate reductase flavoprotein subunit